MKINIYLSLISAAILILAACDDTVNVKNLDSTTIPSSNVSYSKYIQPVFTSKCANAGCHDDQNMAGGLSLTSWANATADFQVVAPGIPQNSKLIWRISGTSGTLMPPVGYWALTKNQIDGITVWVKEGAKNN